MRMRTLALLSVFLCSAFPLLAADPQPQAPAEPIGVLLLDGRAIDVYSWSWGVTQTFDSTGAGSGGGTGKVSMQDFHFTKNVDATSPKLFSACATGQHFPTATFTARKKGQGQQQYLVVKFSDLLVSSYQTGGSAGDTVPVESISFNYSKIELQVP